MWKQDTLTLYEYVSGVLYNCLWIYYQERHRVARTSALSVNNCNC